MKPKNPRNLRLRRLMMKTASHDAPLCDSLHSQVIEETLDDEVVEQTTAQRRHREQTR